MYTYINMKADASVIPDVNVPSLLGRSFSYLDDAIESTLFAIDKFLNQIMYVMKFCISVPGYNGDGIYVVKKTILFRSGLKLRPSLWHV